MIIGVPKEIKALVNVARQPELLGGINIHQGRITCPAVAEAHGLPCTPFLPDGDTPNGR